MLSAKFKASLKRFHDLSWPERVELKRFIQRSESLSGFDVESFNNPLLKVASCSNAIGETVLYCPLATVLLVEGYAINPQATSVEREQAGNAIDAAIAREVQGSGISKMLIVLPAHLPGLPADQWRELRVYERKFDRPVVTGGSIVHHTSQATQYLN